MPQRDKERGRGGEAQSTLAKSYREGRGKSEGDANAEREADKKPVMECSGREERRAGRGEKVGRYDGEGGRVAG